MEAAGVWEHQRLELVEGELINRMGKHRKHSTSITLVNIKLGEIFGRHFVNQEVPIDVAPEDNPTNEPEPDLIVLKRHLSDFMEGNPRAKDLNLAVEISDSSLSFDLSVKARLYARAEIAEYWVLDVAGRRLIVHRDPILGRYESVSAYDDTECVAPISAPDKMFCVADAFAKPLHSRMSRPL